MLIACFVLRCNQCLAVSAAQLVVTLMEVLLIGERGMDGGDAVEEEGADDALTAGDDVSHLAPRQPVPLHPLM